MIQDFIQFVQSQLATNQLFSAAALTSILMSSMYTLRKYPLLAYNRIARLIKFSATVEQQDQLYKYLDIWVATKYAHRFRQVEVETDTTSSAIINGNKVVRLGVEPEPSSGRISLSHQNDYIYIWKNHRYIRLSKTKTKLEAANDVWNMYSRNYTIAGAFAKKAISKLLEEVYQFGLAEERRLKLEKKQIRLYECNSYGDWRYGKTVEGKKFDSLYFSQKHTLLNDIRKFTSKRELYTQLQVPFKRGYLFYGLPGNGKSSISFAIAEELKYDIYVVNPSNLIPDYFGTAINSIPPNSVVLIEDIDSFYNGREAINNNKINFSTFINALSGVERKENIVTIFTTNHYSQLDPALVRAGRCDLALNLENPSIEIISSFLSDMFQEDIHLESARDISFAELQNIYIENVGDLNKVLASIGAKRL